MKKYLKLFFMGGFVKGLLKIPFIHTPTDCLMHPFYWGRISCFGRQANCFPTSFYLCDQCFILYKELYHPSRTVNWARSSPAPRMPWWPFWRRDSFRPAAITWPSSCRRWGCTFWPALVCFPIQVPPQLWGEFHHGLKLPAVNSFCLKVAFLIHLPQIRQWVWDFP